MQIKEPCILIQRIRYCSYIYCPWQVCFTYFIDYKRSTFDIRECVYKVWESFDTHRTLRRFFPGKDAGSCKKSIKPLESQKCDILIPVTQKIQEIFNLRFRHNIRMIKFKNRNVNDFALCLPKSSIST